MQKAPILIVEDCATDVDLLLWAFRDEGVTHPVIVAGTGHEAVQHMADTRTVPALMLLDSTLCDISGFELLRLFRRESALRHLPIVMFTGLEREGDSIRARELKADAFLTKPATYVDLRALVRGLQSQWLGTSGADQTRPCN